MTSVDRVKAICHSRKIPISKLEKDLGFGNGYVGQLKKGVFPSDRLAQIARYLSVSMSYLLGDTDDPTDRSKTHWAEVVQDDDIPEDAIKAAFFKGADMTKEEMDAAWQDAKDYIAFKSEQRRRGGGK